MSLKMRKSKVNHPVPECAVAACMWLLGGVWTPNLLWSLSAGPRRFGELRVDIPGISAKMLSVRRKEMEEKGVVVRTVLATSPPSAEYSLSELGLELLPAIEAIAEIGYKLRLERRNEMVELAGGKPQLKQ
ncbi:helix-turn-helix transcriptional regulator [Pseudomonas syringae pv. syringae]|uniref:winged helix-turn-helix transcriptional regulator n=1 Tax=Pseudomonas syringae TaxID=317 RepID=UPI000CDBA54D|nr:helix-turn-helix domain-containing protein [Pseudomonas syringae]MCH5531440.1 helix-turn-helix transcriptional regulator [Pseudomonas syringae pv. syringae]MCH5541493.1 helix-turn-helix transcriptional regulator [Pseudomonas syringae pv. syringae]MCH5546514.1 helix-turn-helix transcriptional regulator [Pseudomonas syringae pv. syringae]MCH5604876.1 helix-turn-helix transcriptional regulator [Pseudomonas syringae pv. syringae]MCH5609852.1 helix-turn-helix transcriptional regulator [Pseudomon